MAAIPNETPLDEFERWLVALDALSQWLEQLVQKIEREFPTTKEHNS